MRLREFLFSFHGRINRARYWLYVAMAVPFMMFLVLCFWSYAISLPGAYENGGPTPFPKDPLGVALAIVWLLALLGTLIAGLAVMVKRLHDRDKAWWWIFIFFILPSALDAYAQANLPEGPSGPAAPAAIAAGVVALMLSLWALVELGFLSGTVGDNRFGADPLS
jgi:uncharacterized membrane protein YhaH (DUF805 family)